MDVSSDYIKMCDCNEIQDLITDMDLNSHSFWWIVIIYKKCPKCGQRSGTYCKDCRSKLIEKKDGYIGNEECGYHQSIWLPRQDQIQKMMNWEYEYHFWKWEGKEIDGGTYYGQILDDEDLRHGVSMDSLEQLWLAFYMHENHGLVWNGKKWTKEK